MRFHDSSDIQAAGLVERGGLPVFLGLARVSPHLTVPAVAKALSPSMESEFRKFFAMSSADKMNVPLCRLSLNLMICSLGG